SAARRWAPSARVSPNASVFRPARTRVRKPGRWPGYHRAWRSRSRDRSGIEKRGSPGRTSLAAMNITIHASFLPHEDPEASVAFYRDTLGFDVRNDVEYAAMHWITIGPADQPR